MTFRVRAVCQRAVAMPTDRSRLTSANAVVVACGLAVLLQLGLPGRADAQWGKLEKLSGPGSFSGPVFEFRVACVGEVTPEAALAESLTRQAAELTVTARKLPAGTFENQSSEQAANWGDAVTKWEEAADAWALALGDARATLAQRRTRSGEVEAFVTGLENNVQHGRNQYRARSMATSSAGLFWSLCNPNKQRRLAIDIGWSNLRASGSQSYTGSPIHLNMLMASVSVRVLASTKWDVLDVSAGAGPYWFTSAPPEDASPTPNPDGIPALNGVVVQPLRLTFHVPSNWSSLPVQKDGKRWLAVLGRAAAIPSLSWGLTVFPEGFEPGDFGAGEGAARRIPSEWLSTWYVSVNVQPLLRMFGK
jgi:hypothetical protein